jgi:hypothetical protein
MPKVMRTMELQAIQYRFMRRIDCRPARWLPVACVDPGRQPYVLQSI